MKGFCMGCNCVVIDGENGWAIFYEDENQTEACCEACEELI